MKLVHLGDAHLGPSGGRIDPETGLNSRLVDRYKCFRFCVEDGVARGADLILDAGDGFDNPRPTPTERRLRLQAYEPALAAGVPIVTILGNHESPRSPSERHALDTLRQVSPGLVIVDQPTMLYAHQRFWEDDDALAALWTVERHRPPDGYPDEVLQIACLPWPNKQLLLADAENRKLEPGELNQLVREKMMDCARGLAAQLVPEVPAVLLGHFAVDLAEAGGRGRLMLLGGEWTLNVHELLALPFNYFALGHIHKPQCVAGGKVYYCGSPEACSHGEEGEDKVYNLVETSDDPEGWSVKPIATPYRRLVTLTAGEPWSPSEPLTGAIVRLKVPVGADVDLVALRKELDALGVHEYRIETERAETVRRRAVEVSAESSIEDALDAYLAQTPDLAPMREELVAEAVGIERAIAGAVATALDAEDGGAP